MNSIEHVDHTAEINNHLLFPALLKQAWGIFKKKWRTLFALSLAPVAFVFASYTILISTVYIVMKLSGDTDVFTTAYSVFYFAPNYAAAIAVVSGIIIVFWTIYFSLRSTVASVKVLESEAKITARHAWHGISSKTISSLLAVAVLVGIILMGGYALLFVPFLFLVTFYSNAIFANIIEGKKGMDALALSRQYVKGYGATVFVNLLVIFGLGMLFSLLFRLAFGIGGFLILAVYFGKLSILLATLIALLIGIVALIFMVLWKSFAFVFLYSMFKKLQSLKAHHTTDLTEGRKTVKVWLVLSIVSLAIFIGVMAALDKNDRNSRPGSMMNDQEMMYSDDLDFSEGY